MLEFLTEKGKEISQIIAELGLDEWFYPQCGNLQIPKSEYPQVKDLVAKFLEANDDWAMILEEYNDDDMEDTYIVCEKEQLEEF